MVCKESRYQFLSQEVYLYIDEVRPSDVIYFAHALDIYGTRTSLMRARVLAQKSEEATASSASLLATPLSPQGKYQRCFHLSLRFSSWL